MKIAILGCGPTGLAAAQACDLAGHSVDIYSRKTRSALYGAQYLHEPIPGLDYPEDGRKVAYLLQGSIEEYRAKVYGSRRVRNVSPNEYEGEHEAWDIRWSYAQLWDKFFNSIKDIQRIEPRFVMNMQDSGKYDKIINTIPRTQLCTSQSHHFNCQHIWALGDAPGIQLVPLDLYAPDSTVLCSGRKTDSWYRISHVYGHRTVEWSNGERPFHNGSLLPASRVAKPIGTDCNCFPKLMHVGRYGKWKKGVVVHHAYNEVAEAI